MKKIFKSYKDYHKEINKIIKTCVNDTQRAFMLKSYLKNLKFKGYYDKETIHMFIAIDLYLYDKKNLQKKIFKEYHWIMRSYIENHLTNIEKNRKEKISTNLRIFMYRIFEVNHNEYILDFDKHTAIDKMEKIINEDKMLSKIQKFLNTHKEIGIYLYDTFENYRKQHIIKKIINKEIPLTAIEEFLKYNLDIKENTLYIYHLLLKKFTKTTIQKTITKFYLDERNN